MVKIYPFKGVRYNAEKVHDMWKVISPPYDIIDEEKQNKLYELHKYNIIRLELPKEPLSVIPKLIKNWKNENILIGEDKKSLYIYEQKFRVPDREDNKWQKRYGIICLLPANFWCKDVRPHEKTFPHHKRDRIKLYSKIKFVASPIFGIFEDNDKYIKKFLEKEISGNPHLLYDFRDTENVHHRVYKIDNLQKINKLAGMLKNKIVYIADGHHRYESMHILKTKYNYNVKVLSFLSPIADKRDKISLTHRAVVLKENFNFNSFLHTLTEKFHLSNKPISNSLTMEHKNKKYHLRAKKKIIPPNMKNYFSIPTTILHNFILPQIGKENYKEIIYFKSESERQKIESMYSPEELLIFTFPPITSYLLIKVIKSLQGNNNDPHTTMQLPEKTTYFYPKIPAGLVMYEF